LRTPGARVRVGATDPEVSELKRFALVLAVLCSGASIILAGAAEGVTPKYETKLGKLNRSFDGAANETVYAGRLSSPERACKKKRAVGVFMLLNGSAFESDEVKTSNTGEFEARIRGFTPIPDYEMQVISSKSTFGTGSNKGVCKKLDKTFDFAGTG
jgi:hypothetical protein